MKCAWLSAATRTTLHSLLKSGRENDFGAPAAAVANLHTLAESAQQHQQSGKKKIDWQRIINAEFPFGTAKLNFQDFVTSSVEPKKKQILARGPPNYFVSIPIHSKAVEVQRLLLKSEKRLKGTLVPLATLHLTLFVMRLDEVHCLHDAESAARASARQILEEDLTKSLHIPFKGVETFQGKVLYINIAKGAHLKKLYRIAELVRQCFEDVGIHPTDTKSFNPHLTVAKLSKDYKLSRKFKKIDPKFYESAVSWEFGTETVKVLQVCSMLGTKQESGYYKTPIEVNLHAPN